MANVLASILPASSQAHLAGHPLGPPPLPLLCHLLAQGLHLLEQNCPGNLTAGEEDTEGKDDTERGTLRRYREVAVVKVHRCHHLDTQMTCYGSAVG